MRPAELSRPVVSVIMANYNGSPHLAEAVESVRRQTLRDIEIIISDDASTDGSIEIITQLMASDARIKLVRSERNGGPGAARNKALALATGDWIAVVDCDDLMDSARLATLVEAAVCDGADIVADDLIEFASGSPPPPRGLLTGRWARAPFWVDVVDYVRLNHFYGPGPTIGYLKPMFRASILSKPWARYNEALRIAEDYDFILRMLHLGARFRIYPQKLYFYRRHQASISHRLSESVLVALRTANLQFMDEVSNTNPRLGAVLASRMRSIDTALAYEKLLNALKARNFLGALSAVRSRPQAIALLRLPLLVRARRLIQSKPQDRSLIEVSK